MKELSTEEKAKAYDEALERARQIHNEHKAQPFDVMLKVFPELKESEDEKIRKQLLKHLREAASGKSLELSTTDYERWATWVAKQGENNMGISEATKQELDDNLHRALEKETTESWKKFLEGEQKPADKIEQKPQCMVSAEAKEAMYDKPAWSEEDETGLTNTIIMLKEGASLHFNKKDITKAVDWLKSLRDRVQPQPKQEWNEEDETYLDHIITAVKLYYTDYKGEENPWRNELLRWLKSLRPQNRWKPSDEQMDMLAKVCSTLHLTTGENEIMESIYDALERLREE